MAVSQARFSASPYKPALDSRILNFVIRNEARVHHRLWLRNVGRSRLTHPACSGRGTEVRNPQHCSPPNRMTARDQDSAIGEEVCSGCGKPTRERGRLFVVDFGSATA